jgi:hypothetical protein
VEFERSEGSCLVIATALTIELLRRSRGSATETFTSLALCNAADAVDSLDSSHDGINNNAVEQLCRSSSLGRGALDSFYDHHPLAVADILGNVVLFLPFGYLFPREFRDSAPGEKMGATPSAGVDAFPHCRTFSGLQPQSNTLGNRYLHPFGGRDARLDD